MSGVDTDPLNQTLARTTALEASVLKLLADDHTTIMKNAFDEMIESCEELDANVVIDVAASSFVPMLEYCDRNGVHELWREMGHSCILHSIITGKDFLDTCRMFGIVMEKTGRIPSVSSIVWLNPFSGAVEKDGRDFNQTAVYRENERHIKAVLPMPSFTIDMFQSNFLAMMRKGKTFDEAIADPTVPIMRRQRIKMMKREMLESWTKPEFFNRVRPRPPGGNPGGRAAFMNWRIYASSAQDR